MHGFTAPEPSSPPLECTLAGCGGCRRTSAVCTALMILFRASKSSLHFSRACNSRCLLWVTRSSGRFAALAMSSKPMSLATNEDGLLGFSGKLVAFDRRISGGSVGLLGTLASLVNDGLESIRVWFWVLVCLGGDGEFLSGVECFGFAGDDGFRFSCFLPENGGIGNCFS